MVIDSEKEALLAYMSHAHTYYKIQSEALGGPYSAAVIRLVLIGHIKRAPYNKKDLATEAMLDPEILQQIIDELHKLKMIRIEVRHGETYFHASEHALRWAYRATPALAVKMATGFQKAAAAFAKVGLWTSIASPIEKLIREAPYFGYTSKNHKEV